MVPIRARYMMTIAGTTTPMIHLTLSIAPIAARAIASTSSAPITTQTSAVNRRSIV
jgi:hypothetical protein